MPRKIPPSEYAVPRLATSGRRSTVNPFGTARLQNWQIPPGGTEIEKVAAQVQHQVARKFRDLINQSQFGSIAEFARANPEISYERLRSILAGDSWMRFQDMALLADRLGARLEFDVVSTQLKKQNG